MDDDANTWIIRARLLNLLHAKAHMRGAIAFPKNNLSALNFLFAILRSQRILRIPDRHLLLGNAIFKRGVASEMLIRKEEHTFASAKCPLDNFWCIGRCANNASIEATKGLQIGRRI